MGTGIVFVVLVAIWVAYFVQYWSRRREHLATARSVEAFAEAMRVLERRPALRAPATARISTAYAVSPARAVSDRPAPRPQVIAKPHPTTPPPSRGGAPRMSAPTLARRRGPSRPSRPAAPSPSRKVRGLTLLGSLLATLIAIPLAVFTTLLWWVPLIGVGAVGAAFVWLRAGVQVEIAARRATRGRRPHRRPASGQSSARTAPAAAAAPAGERELSTEPAGQGAPELIETSTVTASADSDVRTDGWHPVPVPPPTYTLKAKAERPSPAVSEPAPQVAPSPGPVSAPAVAPEQAEAQTERSAAYGT